MNVYSKHYLVDPFGGVEGWPLGRGQSLPGKTLSIAARDPYKRPPGQKATGQKATPPNKHEIFALCLRVVLRHHLGDESRLMRLYLSPLPTLTLK